MSAQTAAYWAAFFKTRGWDGLDEGVITDLTDSWLASGASASLAAVTGTVTPFPIAGLAAAQGGALTVTGGASSTSGNAGGAVTLKGGAGGATGVGGAATVQGGAGGATSGAGGAVSITAGATTTSGAGASVTITAGAGAAGTNAGGNVNLIPGAAVSTGTPGEVQINSDSAINSVSFPYLSTLVTNRFFVASRACRVKSIIGAVRVQGSGGACTLSFYKVPSGTEVGSGTILHSGSYNMVGTVDTNQSLTLSTTVADVTLAAGDGIGFVLTGTPTSAVGVVSVHLAPC